MTAMTDPAVQGHAAGRQPHTAHRHSVGRPGVALEDGQAAMGRQRGHGQAPWLFAGWRQARHASSGARQFGRNGAERPVGLSVLVVRPETRNLGWCAVQVDHRPMGWGSRS